MRALAVLIARLAGAGLIACLAAAAAHAAPLGEARQLTFDGARSGEGYFSHDGRRMIFQSERTPGNPFYQMYVLDLATGDVERISTGVGKTTCGWLHPDGRHALFASTQYDPEAEAKMRAELDFRASGGSRRYAWDYDPAYDLVERDLETGELRRLTEAEGYDAEGAWSPDGSRIVFASNRRAYAGALSAEDAARLERDPAWFMDLYVMGADGSGLRRITDAPGYDGGPFWSADGERIAFRRFSEDGARAEIYTIRPDGTDERRLTDLGAMSWAPFFHPSGAYLIFATNLHGFSNFELYMVDAEGACEPVRVTEREGFDGLAAFSPDGRRLSWTSNATGSGNSQIFVADWDHDAALKRLAASPLRARGAGPLDGTSPDIEAADLRRHVVALASEEMAGRLTGTEGERAAAAYVAAALEGLGLAPEGDDGTMIQRFPFTAGVALGDGNRLDLSIDGAVATLALGDDWSPTAFSKVGTTETTPVVFAGYGLVAPAEGPAAGDAPGLDSYGDLDVTGKWVLLWRGLPGDVTAERRTHLSRFADLRYKASVAKARGAAGVIFAPPLRDGFDDGLPRLAYEAASGETGIPVLAVDRAAMRRMLSVLGADLEPMAAEIEAGRSGGRDLIGVAAAATVALDFERKEGRNVLGRLDLDGLPPDAPGARPPLLVGAHLDHLGRGETSGSLARGDEQGRIHYGADDNASGVAAMIEVAQHLAALRDPGRLDGARLDGARDVIFAAWSGEELGLLGSAHYVGALARARGGESLADTISAYVNLDMVGRLRDRLIASGLASSPVWAREIERRNVVVGLPIVATDDVYLPTDATELYLKGVPTLSLFTGAHAEYHTPRDTPDTLNYEGARDVARLVALIARSLAASADEPAYVEVARPAGQGGRRRGAVYLGTIPDYATEDVAGVPLSGVVKGGPAEAAGVRGGDVVVALAGQTLGNIYDYVCALNGLKPGEPVPIVVERQGARVTLEVTPGVRE